MITTIIFDLSEVLLQGIIGSEKYLLNKLNIPVSATYFYTPDLDELFLGKITEETFWKRIIAKYSWNVSVDDLKQAVRKNFKEIKGTRKIIEKLKQSGYTLALLSNHAKEWIEYCEGKYTYHKLFHNVTYSYELRLSKPNKKIFNKIFVALQVQPQNCIFIDDNLENLNVAKTLQIKTIQFVSAQLLKSDLKKSGVNF